MAISFSFFIFGNETLPKSLLKICNFTLFGYISLIEKGLIQRDETFVFNYLIFAQI
jgi:hypothetical protein